MHRHLIRTLALTAATLLGCAQGRAPVAIAGTVRNDACAASPGDDEAAPALPAPNATVHRDALVSYALCADVPSNAPRLGCAEELEETTDAEIRRLVAAIRAEQLKVPERQRAGDVAASQRAWSRWREEACSLEAGPHPGAGLGWAMGLHLCRAELGQNWASGLRAILHGLRDDEPEPSEP